MMEEIVKKIELKIKQNDWKVVEQLLRDNLKNQNVLEKIFAHYAGIGNTPYGYYGHGPRLIKFDWCPKCKRKASYIIKNSIRLTNKYTVDTPYGYDEHYIFSFQRFCVICKELSEDHIERIEDHDYPGS
ncbi:MAG: hypothetical protein ACTSO9_21640 [Candidatus Helarchaeota archaeon]